MNADLQASWLLSEAFNTKRVSTSFHFGPRTNHFRPQAKVSLGQILAMLLRKFFFRTALLLLMLCGMASFAFANSPVTLKPATEIDRPAIRLSDVFEGVPEAIDRDIATTPAPGKSVTYNVRVLSDLATHYRLDWQAQSLTDAAVISRAATHITEDMVTKAVAEKLKPEIGQGAITADLDGRNFDIALPSSVPAEFVLENMAYDAATRRFKAELVAAKGTSSAQKIQIGGKVDIRRDIPVLARRLDAGTTVSEADLTFISMPAERISQDMLDQTSAIVGNELRHDMAEGASLRSRDIIPPRLVTRGSFVEMRIETPYMVITAQGRALQDGGKGDVVRVTNTRSKRTVEGIIEGPGVVRVRGSVAVASAG